MFNWLKRKSADDTLVKDIIWIDSANKWKYISQTVQADETANFVFWFDETLEQARRIIPGRENAFLSAKTLHFQDTANCSLFFGEHYPTYDKEQQLFKSLHLREVRVLSALDEPLLKKFGAGHIVQLLQTMGLQPGESIQHQFVSKAIRNAQKKIQRKIPFEQTAFSQDEWLKQNLTD